MTTASPLVEVRDLTVAYRRNEGWLRVLHTVGFAIARGETFGLAGESGCGKSTLAYHLLGYRHPHARIESGGVLFEGRNLLALDRRALDRLRGDRVSFVPQNPTTALSPGMRVGDQVVEVLLAHGAQPDRAAATAHATELFDLVGLPGPTAIRRRFPHELSGGQQQRVVIAMAIACRPDLLVLDEPTTALDVTTQKQILDLLRDLRSRLGMAMLYVTHDLGVLTEIADRVGIMYAGHMVEVGRMSDLFSAPRHPYTRGLIDSRPRIDAGEGGPVRGLQGLLRRQELPAGCPFAPRCGHAEPSCAAKAQRLEPVAVGHEVACQRWRSLAVAVPAAISGSARQSWSREPAPPVVEIENVALGYGTRSHWIGRMVAPPVAVVHGFSLSMERGEVLALVGESGSGKSTIARALSGLIAPLAGRILLKGQVLAPLIGARPPALRRQIQYVFQNPDASLNPRMRIGAILARPLKVFYRLDSAATQARIERGLDDVRLDGGYARRYPDELSGGERQRVAIARALVADPVVLLCDEVLSALDVSVQAAILELLLRLRREHSLSMLFISHDLAVVRHLADRVGVLFGGELVEFGTAAEIFAAPFHPYTRSLMQAIPGAHMSDGVSEPAPGRVQPSRPTPGGCVFVGRCPLQLGRICATTPPPWQRAGDSLRIRCHLPLGELG